MASGKKKKKKGKGNDASVASEGDSVASSSALSISLRTPRSSRKRLFKAQSTETSNEHNKSPTFRGRQEANKLPKKRLNAEANSGNEELSQKKRRKRRRTVFIPKKIPHSDDSYVLKKYDTRTRKYKRPSKQEGSSSNSLHERTKNHQRKAKNTSENAKGLYSMVSGAGSAGSSNKLALNGSKRYLTCKRRLFEESSSETSFRDELQNTSNVDNKTGKKRLSGKVRSEVNGAQKKRRKKRQTIFEPKNIPNKILSSCDIKRYDTRTRPYKRPLNQEDSSHQSIVFPSPKETENQVVCAANPRRTSPRRRKTLYTPDLWINSTEFSRMFNDN